MENGRSWRKGWGIWPARNNNIAEEEEKEEVNPKSTPKPAPKPAPKPTPEMVESIVYGWDDDDKRRRKGFYQKGETTGTNPKMWCW